MRTNVFRKTIAGLVLAGGLVAGTAGLAAAETGTTSPSTPPTQEQVCHRAEVVWQRLQKLDDRLHERYQKLVALRDKAAAEGHTDLAAKLTQRLERLKEHHLKVEAHLKQLHDKAADRCSLPDATTAPLES